MTQKTNKSKQFSDFFLKKSENKLNKFHNNCLIYIEIPASRCYIVFVPRVDHGVKNGETVMDGQMLNYLPGEGVLRIREFCGLNHEFQVAELDFPPLPETVRQCG